MWPLPAEDVQVRFHEMSQRSVAQLADTSTELNLGQLLRCPNACPSLHGILTMQPAGELNSETVAGYMQQMVSENGSSRAPTVLLYRVGGVHGDRLVVLDGHHKLEAARRLRQCASTVTCVAPQLNFLIIDPLNEHGESRWTSCEQVSWPHPESCHKVLKHMQAIQTLQQKWHLFVESWLCDHGPVECDQNHAY